MFGNRETKQIIT